MTRLVHVCVFAAGVAVCASLSAAPSLAAPPSGQAHGVGRTSYDLLPFTSTIYAPCWNCSYDLEPAELFFSANPSSPYLNTSLMAQVRAAAGTMAATGVVPSGGAQRWEDTYEASFPAGTFPGEPSWIQNDRANGNYPNRPEFVAWRNFISSNEKYWDLAYDGGTMPNQSNYFRSWGGQWGHLSPLTPLAPADCPPDMPVECTWGDFYAYRWSLTAAQTGAFGLMLSDFSDSQPYQSQLHDFNPGIVTAFAAANDVQSALAGVGAAAAARVINTTMFLEWNDFLAQGYANFYKALATRIGAATKRKALIIDQCSMTPSYRRVAGTDQRIIAQTMDPASYLCIWDDQVIQTGRGGPVANPIMQELAGAVVAAAREPLVRNGADLEADDSAYWSAIASYYPTLDQASQQEVGYKLLKRLWVWEAWAHIANRSGGVQRALSFTSRDYWDAGSIAALDPLTKVLQTIRPSSPFGPALYYSTSVERQVESGQEKQPAGAAFAPYLSQSALQQVIDNGGTFGYYVSDAALPAISVAAGNAPSAWLVIGAGNMLPAGELSALKAIAPVATSPQQLAELPGQPVRFSAGLAGFVFRDQGGIPIVVVSNPSASPAAGGMTGTVSLTGLSGSSFTLVNLLSATKTKLTGANGTVTLPVSLSRWDTEIYALRGG